jgi:hypothetical protein
MHGTIQQVLSGEAQFAIVHADNRVAIKEIPDESIDYAACDPPYSIGSRDPSPEEILAFLQGAELDTAGDFMGRAWQLPTVDMWREHFRVLKPGAHLAVFCGPQTADLMSMAIRLAGFERRDDVPIYGSAAWNWIQGQGMKKGLDVSKAIDEAAGAERDVVGTKVYGDGHVQNSHESIGYGGCEPDADTRSLTAASSHEAQRWDGFETDLASRHESILIFRKPIATVTSEQLRAATGWIHWHVVTDYRKPEARVKACAKWDVADPGGDLQERDVRALDPEAESWRELRHRWTGTVRVCVPAEVPFELEGSGVRGVDGVVRMAKVEHRQTRGPWRAIASTDPKPYKTWTICNVAANVFVYGTGAISIDRCRTYTDWSDRPDSWKRSGHSAKPDAEKIAAPPGTGINCHPKGRHPANVVFIHDCRCERAGERVVQTGTAVERNVDGLAKRNVVYGSMTHNGIDHGYASADGTESIQAYSCLCGCRSCGREWTAPSGGKAPSCECGVAGQWRCAVARLDAQSGHLHARGNRTPRRHVAKGCVVYGPRLAYEERGDQGDSGGASRFFPTFDWADEPDPFCYAAKSPRAERDSGLDHRNTHVAVKPQKVLEYLVRLVGAPGAVGLTAWAGSGSEVAAMVSQGCRAIGIEWDAVHHADAMQRVPALVRGERRRAPDPRREPTPKPTPVKAQPRPAAQQLSFL